MTSVEERLDQELRVLAGNIMSGEYTEEDVRESDSLQLRRARLMRPAPPKRSVRRRL